MTANLPKIKIYNSLSQQKEVLSPIVPGKVGLYLCGITVYDLCHIGHARSGMTFDIVVRYLRWLGYDVNFVRNITDVDDKIIKRANERGEDSAELSQKFIDVMHEDEAKLGMLRPDHEPRATVFMPEIIEMIENLISKQFAYVADNGDVCFEVRKFQGYGKLSKRNIDELRSGERVEIAEGKKDPLDFVLWKLAKPGEPSWESPWGAGRPGWHIECSAMSNSCLGANFDIHGGGLDLKFPHHENEIAQSEAANGKTFANIWMHNGLLQINKEKMSKSLGNFLTIQDVLKKHAPETVRFFILGCHYRKPLNYSEEMLEQAKRSLETLYIALRDIELKDIDFDDQEAAHYSSEYTQKFKAVMNDDFNTPEALAICFEMAKEINLAKKTHPEKAKQIAVELKYLAQALGVLNLTPEEFLKGSVGDDEVDVAKIENLIAQRNQARAEKNWGLSDQVRDELSAMGIVLEDGASGTTWRKL